MKSLTLTEARVIAGMMCAKKKITVDIYPSQEADRYTVKEKYLRNSPLFTERASHENGKVIIKNAAGKTTYTVDLEPAKEKKTASKGKDSGKESQPAEAKE